MTRASAGRLRATVVVDPDRFGRSSIEVEGDLYRHLFRARRLAVGDGLRVVDGAGRAKAAVVADVSRDSALLELGETLASPEPRHDLELWVAPPKPERAAWLVEKATELGVSAVRWLRTERSGPGYREGALERQRRVAIAALQQCGGARLPELSGPHSFENRPESAGQLLVLDPDGAPLAAAPSGAATIVVGPEGGFVQAELDALGAAGASRWRLGARTLRVETAAVVAAGRLLTGTGAPA